MENAIKEKALVNTKIAQAKHGKNVKMWYKILMKDTSIMSESQLEDHQLIFIYIKRKLGNSRML